MELEERIEQIPLFIKAKDYRFSNKESWFYFTGVMEYKKEQIILYTNQESKSTYSLQSIKQYGDMK
jgi:hypothetical protein